MQKVKRSLIIIFALLLAFLLFYGDLSVSAAEEKPSSMRVGWTEEPDSLSPFISYNTYGAEIFLLIYDPLVRLDENLKPVPCLAEKWTVSQDNLTWTFKLAQGVKWHDGEPFTSKDVKYTYDMLLKSELGQYAGALKGIKDIQCPDDGTVIITTEKPKANMLQITAPILPEHIWKAIGEKEIETWPNQNPVGTGPFKFAEMKTGEYIKLSANGDYIFGKPKADELIFVKYANEDTLVQSLKVGEIDAAFRINSSQMATLEGAENIKTIAAPGFGFTQIGFNCWNSPKSKGNKIILDKSVRQAIDYSIDKKQVLDVAYSGYGIAGTTLIPPDGFWHYEPSKEELRTFDLEKAKKLLEEAGYTDVNGDGIREDKNGNKLSFRFFLLADNPEEVKAGQMIASMAKAAGIELKVETVDDGVMYDNIIAGNFDMFIWGWGSDADPTTILNVISTKEIQNQSDSFYSNPLYDKLLEEQATAIDENERQKLVWQMQKIAYEDAPYIILTYDVNLQGVRTDRFEGWKQIPENGSYFMNLTDYNYVNAVPKGAVQAKSSIPTALIVVLAVAAVIIYKAVRKKSKKSTAS